jgi:hypothetical protein
VSSFVCLFCLFVWLCGSSRLVRCSRVHSAWSARRCLLAFHSLCRPGGPRVALSSSLRRSFARFVSHRVAVSRRVAVSQCHIRATTACAYPLPPFPSPLIVCFLRWHSSAHTQVATLSPIPCSLSPLSPPPLTTHNTPPPLLLLPHLPCVCLCVSVSLALSSLRVVSVSSYTVYNRCFTLPPPQVKPQFSLHVFTIAYTTHTVCLCLAWSTVGL